ncbi:proteasome adapter and scaffold protein ECM29-like [Papaver somniferum]|uniref:proteasome adapter and scaffold protein ECM29-like n=1 Tax=Papaver somniferum TaxID=3469 RepID=UPI000E6F484A|nr:proteasome adapter and scaffold protein ECM29-like [Papaver somniferum]
MTETSSSTAAMAKSDEDREEILDRMLTRLAFTDDDKLDNLLFKLLPYSISSLSSQSSAVRKKVMEILTHVNKRVKNQLQISLPVSELWKMYIEANAAPMVKNFCIVYIEMAFDRLSLELGILHVVEALELSSELVYVIYLAACSDSYEPVIKRGEELLKRKAADANLEDPQLINKLFLLFNGMWYCRG